MKKFLIVVDMQNDFVSGALGSKEAEAIVPNVVDRIMAAKNGGEEIIFTRDTHFDDYLQTREGRMLPVPHCIKDSGGWQLIDEISDETGGCVIIDKPTFGSVRLPDIIKDMLDEDVPEFELIGLCTDICVISNAMILKAAFPESDIAVRASCCAGVTPESHQNALNAMKVCQIDVI